MSAACPRCAGLTRRRALGALALGGSGLVLGGCDPNTGLPGLGNIGASLVSAQQEAEAGDQAWDQIKAKTPVDRDPAINARVQRIAERVIAASGSEIPPGRWDVVVFDTPEVNAFALPGGHVGVYRGILGVAQDDAQLATVIAHEVGHVNAHHPAQRMGASAVTGIGSEILGALLGGANADLISAAAGAGAEYLVLLPFSRAQELEADRLGLGYMAKAGYPPDEALTFWQRMMAASGRGSAPAIASTHPSDQTRIAQIEQLLPQAERVYESRTG